MRANDIQVRKVTPVIGAEIHGVDLSQPLSDRQFTVIHDALTRHLVIFFRDQQISVEQHMAFGRRFGELIVHPAAGSGVLEHPEIRVVEADANSTRVAGEGWHSDLSCQEEPPMGSILYIKEVPPDGGGDTGFTNMYLAYDKLSERMKAHLDGLTAIHDSAHVFTQSRYTRADKTMPRAEHPIVRTHPVSGRKALFVNAGFTTGIVGLPKVEGDAILQYLFRHCEAFEFQCRFSWRANSIAFWDNRCAMHKAVWDYFPNRRYGHRVTVKGGRPV